MTCVKIDGCVVVLCMYCYPTTNKMARMYAGTASLDEDNDKRTEPTWSWCAACRVSVTDD